MLMVMPYVSSEECFALKGGSAINFFVRDVPRLSVDIDLTYLPLEERAVSLRAAGEALKRISRKIKKALLGINIREVFSKSSKDIGKLFVSDSDVQIKIEINEVLRSSIFPCERRELANRAEELFEMSMVMATLSNADLYGGKLCAALDRQHPRDFFDIKVLLENEGITDDIRKAFVVYLAGHNRPINELIEPRWKDIRLMFENELSGMTVEPVSYDDLITSRDAMFSLLKKTLTINEKKFLLSVKEGKPEWSLMDIAGIDKLPSIQWKLLNIKRMPRHKHLEEMSKLEKALQL
jgi:predicted nucleotidyltransferase component of viral defense system